MSGNQPQAMTRPDWAAGLEWEGWKPTHSGAQRLVDELALSVERCSANGCVFGIWDMQDENQGIEIGLPSPESALRIANAIAAEFGGWA